MTRPQSQNLTHIICHISRPNPTHPAPDQMSSSISGAYPHRNPRIQALSSISSAYPFCIPNIQELSSRSLLLRTLSIVYPERILTLTCISRSYPHHPTFSRRYPAPPDRIPHHIPHIHTLSPLSPAVRVLSSIFGTYPYCIPHIQEYHCHPFLPGGRYPAPPNRILTVSRTSSTYPLYHLVSGRYPAPPDHILTVSRTSRRYPLYRPLSGRYPAPANRILTVSRTSRTYPLYHLVSGRYPAPPDRIVL